MDRERILREPPGHRRLWLALRAKGLDYSRLAEDCNCDRTIISRVARGMCSTDLHRRIRARAAELSGLDQAWLFEPTQAQANTPAQSDVNSCAA
jgi:hypothetical protein